LVSRRARIAMASLSSSQENKTIMKMKFSEDKYKSRCGYFSKKNYDRKNDEGATMKS